MVCEYAKETSENKWHTVQNNSHAGQNVSACAAICLKTQKMK